MITGYIPDCVMVMLYRKVTPEASEGVVTITRFTRVGVNVSKFLERGASAPIKLHPFKSKPTDCPAKAVIPKGAPGDTPLSASVTVVLIGEATDSLRRTATLKGLPAMCTFEILTLKIAIDCDAGADPERVYETIA